MKSMAEERQKPDLEEVEKSGKEEPEEEKVAEDSEKVDSTDLGSEKAESPPKEAEPVAEHCGEPDEDLKKPVRADSCNGSSNSIEKEVNRNNKSDSGESNEPVKENSDVQSSASRSREEGDDTVRGNEDRSGGGVKVEEEELTGEARWFFDFVQAVRSCHKFGSVVERRLRSQVNFLTLAG